MYKAGSAEPDPEKAAERAKKIFDKFDTDGDGIGLEEVTEIVRQVDPDVTDESIQKLFKAADTDGSEQIDFDEFMAAINSDHTDEFSFDDLVIKKMKFDLKADALGYLFLLVFVMYPGFTNKIFEGFMCRNLGDISLMDVDYTMECYTTSWYITASICGVLVALWPIGIPVLLFVAMYRARNKIKAGDEDTLKFWDFALGDYNLDHWYWEVVELIRKMVMTGLIGLLGRGSIFQVFCATVISFLFFAASLHAKPFDSAGLNIVKIVSEFQLFIILLVCVVLQTDARGLLADTRTNYGSALIATTLLSAPILVYVVIKNFKDAKRDLLGKEEPDKTQKLNPMHTDLEMED